MPRYAIIENQSVVNVVIADETYAADQKWVLCDQACPGWSYIDNQFIEPVFETEQNQKPTLEQLLTQANQLQAQIAALMAEKET